MTTLTSNWTTAALTASEEGIVAEYRYLSNLGYKCIKKGILNTIQKSYKLSHIY